MQLTRIPDHDVKVLKPQAGGARQRSHRSNEAAGGGGEGVGGAGGGGGGERGTAREGRREGGERVGVFRGDNLSEDHDDPLWTQGTEEHGVEEKVGQKRDRGGGGGVWGGRSCQLPQGKVECESAHFLKSQRPCVSV